MKTEVTIHNRLSAEHPWHGAADRVLRAALNGLPGSWEVSVLSIDRLWVRIDIVAPDGAMWSWSVSTHEGPRVEEMAETIRAACVRHCRVKAGGVRRRRGPAASVAPPATPKGTAR
jgi:hypothetical protein